MDNRKIPRKYIPLTLSKKDSIKQQKGIIQSRKSYLKKKYINRPLVRSFVSKSSPHIQRATKLYGVPTMEPTNALSRASGCEKWALEKIINKGEGAYYSSGSRPNQTPQSWGYARLGSALTGGPASQIDYDILKNGCSRRSLALKQANKTRKNKKA